MHRIFVSESIKNEFAITDIEQLHYLKDVLRLKINDEVMICDNTSTEYLCVITEVTKENVLVRVKEKTSHNIRPVHLTVACAIPKKDDMDEIIDKLTQLEVTNIIPMETERTIVKLDADKRESRLARWKKIAQNASQQSQRSDIPEINIMKFQDVILNSREYNLKLIPTLIDERKHIRDVIADFKQGHILVLIGPEGDFTPQEVKLAIDNGCLPVSLGNTVLRVGTAAIAISSYIKFALDEQFDHK